MVDPKIMGELLNEPGVRGKVKRMTPAELQWFKESLVSEGVYAQYVLERQKKQVKKMVKETFSQWLTMAV